MSETDHVTTVSGCHFPGCTEPSRPDAATGRPAKYCEQVVDGVLHNRANAWHARHKSGPTPSAPEVVSALPVSMARATLEEQVKGLPAALTEVREYLDGIVMQLHLASDLEAAGAEVEDARRDALALTAAAEQRSSAADRARRDAEATAAEAVLQRDEADAAAAELQEQLVAAAAELERVRAESLEALERVRGEAAAEIARIEQLAAEVQASAAAAQEDLIAERAARSAAEDAVALEREVSVQLRGELARAHRDGEAARVQAASSDAASLAASDALRSAEATIAELRESVRTARTDLEASRRDARSDLEAVREQNADLLRRERESADQRVAAALAATEANKNTADAYLAQLRALQADKSAAAPQPRKGASGKSGDAV